MSVQAPSSVVRIRPARSLPNPETARDNRFLSVPDLAPEDIANRAQGSIWPAAPTLKEHGHD